MHLVISNMNIIFIMFKHFTTHKFGTIIFSIYTWGIKSWKGQNWEISHVNWKILGFIVLLLTVTFCWLSISNVLHDNSRGEKKAQKTPEDISCLTSFISGGLLSYNLHDRWEIRSMPFLSDPCATCTLLVHLLVKPLLSWGWYHLAALLSYPLDFWHLLCLLYGRYHTCSLLGHFNSKIFSLTKILSPLFLRIPPILFYPNSSKQYFCTFYLHTDLPFIPEYTEYR